MLLALESMTTLLIERLGWGSLGDRCSFWKIFLEQVLLPLSKLLSEVDQSRLSSTRNSVVLWGKWALVTWTILADCAIQSASELVSDLVESLMHEVVERSNSQWLSKIKGAEHTAKISQGVIYGQELMEIWVCLIKLLDGASLKTGCATFWDSFNKEVLCQKQSDPKADEPSAKGLDVALDASGWHLFELVATLGKLHQFDRHGSSSGDLRPSSNWKPITHILQRGWLESATDGGLPPSERRLKEYLLFHHGLIQLWGWSPCVETAVYVYRGFAASDFRDQSTEPGYRLPQFLQRMFAAPADLTMAITDSVDKHDRCFEILLKILAKTIRSQVEVIESCEGVSQVAMDESQGSSAFGSSPVPNQVMNRRDLIKDCKRMLSSISPAVVKTYPVSGIANQSYSTLCNTCNLLLYSLHSWSPILSDHRLWDNFEVC